VKYTSVLASALALLAAMFVSGIQAQEFDPTNYPLTPAEAHASQRSIPRNVKRGSAHYTEHSTANKNPKPSAGVAHRDVAKSATVRKVAITAH